MKVILFAACCLAVINGQAIQDNLLECPAGPGYYPHPKSCAFFYICKEYQTGNFEKFVFRCPPGTLYDAMNQVCTLERFAHCEGEPFTSTKKARKLQTTQPPTTLPTTPAPFHCSQEGFYRNPQNCNIFIQCHKFSNGTYTEHNFNCPEGSFYNQEGPNPSCVSPSDEQPLPKKCPPLNKIENKDYIVPH